MIGKSWALAACTAVAVVAISGCSGIGGQLMTNEASVLREESAIGAEKAREIALEHAGFSPDDVTIAHEGRDTEYGRLVHEVEFYTDTREYDYVIDAETGEIVSFDEDAERYVIADWHRETPPSTDSSAFIGEDTARAIALADASLSDDDVENMRIELDYDNRVARYEVEFDGPGKSYEYEIAAADGTIINFETVL